MSVTVRLSGPQLPGQIHAFYYALWLQARPVAKGVDAHHMRYHMLLGRTSTMSCMGDTLLQHGDHSRLGEAINSKDLSEPTDLTMYFFFFS